MHIVPTKGLQGETVRLKLDERRGGVDLAAESIEGRLSSELDVGADHVFTHATLFGNEPDGLEDVSDPLVM